MPSFTLEKITIRKIFYIIIFSGLLSIPLILVWLPADFFDSGQTLCPSKALLDIECPGCGITRAIQHALHLEFKTAWEYNKLVVVVIPFVVYLWLDYLKELYILIKKKN